MKLKLFVVSIVLSLLSACVGVAEAPVVETVELVPVETIELEFVETVELGLTVDVQTVAEVQYQDDIFLIDVREQHEYDAGHIPEITLIPMSEIESRLDEIPTDKEVIVTCRSGNRSGQVTKFLQQNGFDNIHNMEGGILAWEKAGYAVER